MSDDLKQRLRGYAMPDDVAEELMEEAADRIEQLEAALREIADGPRDASRSFAWLFTDLKIEARKALDAK